MTFRLLGGFGLVLSFYLLGGCGGDSAPAAPVCSPGRSVGCSGSGQCSGYQVCRDDGSGYEGCICAGGETFGGAGPHSGLIGAACEGDQDCREGFSCLTSISSMIEGQGPSSGLCVVDCLENPDLCPRSDPDTECVELQADVALCLPTCTLGDPAPDEVKCRGRVDLVCAEKTRGAGVGFCRPACRSDLDCGERVCDLGTGLCGDQSPTGAPIGAACDPKNPNCMGGCIDHGSGYAECSGVCRLGIPGCGQKMADGPPFDFFCYLDPAISSGNGDLGYCARTCDCDDDCGRADAVCEPLALLTPDTGRAGVCGPKLFGSGAARPGQPCK